MIHVPRKAAVATAALSAVLIALTGCSSAQGGGAPADSSGGTTDAGAIAAAQEQVEKYSGIVDGFMPTDPLSDPSALSGKSVVDIPAVAPDRQSARPPGDIRRSRRRPGGNAELR